MIKYNSKLNNSMKFKFSAIYNTALHMAVKKERIEIIKLLLSNDKIDVNIPFVLYIFIFK